LKQARNILSSNSRSDPSISHCNSNSKRFESQRPLLHDDVSVRICRCSVNDRSIDRETLIDQATELVDFNEKYKFFRL
jgi:hypothetical protein